MLLFIRFVCYGFLTLNHIYQSIFFFLVGFGFELRSSACKAALYHLRHTSSIYHLSITYPYHFKTESLDRFNWLYMLWFPHCLTFFLYSHIRFANASVCIRKELFASWIHVTTLFLCVFISFFYSYCEICH
jgi:hypothetical protein